MARVHLRRGQDSKDAIYCCNSVDKPSANCNLTILRRKLWLTMKKDPKAKLGQQAGSLSLYRADGITSNSMPTSQPSRALPFLNRIRAPQAQRRQSLRKSQMKKLPCIPRIQREYKIETNFKLIRGLSLKVILCSNNHIQSLQTRRWKRIR